jgi:integrase
VDRMKGSLKQAIAVPGRSFSISVTSRILRREASPSPEVAHLPGHTQAGSGETDVAAGHGGRGHVRGRDQDHARPVADPVVRRVEGAFPPEHLSTLRGHHRKLAVDGASCEHRPAEDPHNPPGGVRQCQGIGIHADVAPHNPAPGIAQGVQRSADLRQPGPRTWIGNRDDRKGSCLRTRSGHAWTATEARAFLQAAREAGPQPAAFYALALDSGARKGELCGLSWGNLDLDAATMRIVQQLLAPGAEPTFGPTKTGKPRAVALAPETVELLRANRKQQREVMMANRTTYRDLGLVFAKQWPDLQRSGEMLGYPLQMNNLGQREYAQLIKAANVRAIRFHGLRHTCAALLLQARQPVHVVSERLGHTKVSMTMGVYAHVLPDMQRDAAATLGALLHG